MHENPFVKWLFVAGLMVIAMAGLWLIPQNRNDREVWEGGGVASGSTGRSPHEDLTRAREPVGTTGTHDGAAETHDGEVITEIETITGANDGMTLVGRRVDLHADVQDRASDVAFWIGPRDNRLLVVLGRDTRDGVQRQEGRPPSHGVTPVHGGQRATVSGVVRQVPEPEARYSWNLTRRDEQELQDRKIYIVADTVRPEGHGDY